MAAHGGLPLLLNLRSAISWVEKVPFVFYSTESSANKGAMMAGRKFDQAGKSAHEQWTEPTLVQYEFRFGAEQRAALARLGIRRLDEAHPGEWVCAFQLQGLEDSRVRLARSTDGLQAVTIASAVIRQSLDRLNDVSSDRVPYWAEFPRYFPFCYGLQFHENLCEILDREIKRKERQLARRPPTNKKPRD